MAGAPKKSSKSRRRRESASEAMLEGIALLPEIAIARVGGSGEALACYEWSKHPDDNPGGSGKTTLKSRPTLGISAAGEIQREAPKPIPPIQHELRRLFRLPLPKRQPVEFTQPVEDGRAQLFKRVCPWFVLFAKWKDRGWQVLLPQDLEKIGVSQSSVSWHVVVANRKAYNMTLKFADIIYAEAAIGGDQKDGYGDPRKGLITRQLTGRSDADYWIKHGGLPYKTIDFNNNERLIPKGDKRFDLGRIQAPVFSKQYGIRLRVVPPAGAVYGPTNLAARIKFLVDKVLTPDEREKLLNDWDNWYHLEILGADLKARYCILNPESAWAQKVVKPKQEIRTEPGPQFAHIEKPKDKDSSFYYSLGLIDDFSDGIVTVSMKTNKGRTLTAQARIVVGPPDLAPDRRHPVRLFEALDDRAYLGGASSEGLPDKLNDDELRGEVLEMFQRAYETVGLTNIDAMNHRLSRPFKPETHHAAPGNLPLTQLGHEKHRRLATLESLEDLFREQRKRKNVRRVVLEPGPENDRDGLINFPPDDDTGEVPEANAFNRMPALMRGSQVDPLHLTKRQIAVLRRWAATLKPRRSGKR
jgi:hypothetical protein